MDAGWRADAHLSMWGLAGERRLLELREAARRIAREVVTPALAAGAADYIAKPFTPEQVRLAVEKASQVRHLAHVGFDVVARECVLAVSLVTAQEHRRLGGVDPGEQVGIVGRVVTAVVGATAHALVHAQHTLD